MNIFQNSTNFPLLLAPLAGVSDHPFRRICQKFGADLTYVEMLSATALLYKNQKTLAMCKRHESESILGVQLTGRSADEVARAVEFLDTMSFETIDINMGCPVSKVVGTGCGSGILKDPQRVSDTVRLARGATSKPLSAKIRIGWDRNSVNAVEVAQRIEEAGADWITIHGRCRSESYGDAVDLDQIKKVKDAVKIPVYGNGNLFTTNDIEVMRERTHVDGAMISRGALGNPWIFSFAKGLLTQVTLESWLETVLLHLDFQSEEYGKSGMSALCMRKHLLWYAKGWPGVKALREKINSMSDLSEAKDLICQFATDLKTSGVEIRSEHTDSDAAGSKFRWDPKYEMDRTHDRGVGHILELAST